MKFENTKVFNFESALRGMRNPKESWSKSDSYWEEDSCIRYGDKECAGHYVIGENDMKLAQTLVKAGSEHRKFLRQIFVCVDITAPLYWWKEFDTYKVGTVANSTSTMHKIHSKPITKECFEMDDFQNIDILDASNTYLSDHVDEFIEVLETLRQRYLECVEKSKSENVKIEKSLYKNISKKYWKELIRWIPESWLQTRTVTMNYENLIGMCSREQRRFHKLNEWSGKDNPNLTNFISWVRTLPYAQDLIFIDEKEE